MASLAVGLGGSLLSGLFGSKGAKKAANAQVQALQQAIGEQRRQFDTARADNMPFVQGGYKGLGGFLDLLGLNGADVQAAAIEQLKGSPGFTSRYDTGVDTILQNASATGGLRGGNTQTGLAQFGSSLLDDVIQRQLGGLGGLIQTGSGTAMNLGQLGQENANAISELLAGQGRAKATGIAGSYGAWNNVLNDMQGQIQGFGQKKWGW